jgi:hypothetical protein
VSFPSLPNIEYLVDGNGEITIGRIGPIHCAVTAVDDDMTYAQLVRRNGETLEQLLVRLERAIKMAKEEEIVIDEINNGRDHRL